MAIQGVLFDLGNTLVSYYQAKDFNPILRKIIKQCCRSLADTGICFDEQSVFEKAKELNKERPDLAVYPLADRLQLLFGQEMVLSTQQINDLIDEFMKPIFSAAKVDTAAVPLLQALRRMGIKTGILSNTPWGCPSELWYSELKRHDLADNIDLALFCVDVGWRKPAKIIFNTALQKLGLAAQDTIYVGDDPCWDIEGARNAGLTPVLLTRDKVPLNIEVATIKSLEEVLLLVN